MLASPVLSARLFVGAGGSAEGCTHSSLTDAVGAAAISLEDDTIFVARDQGYTNQRIRLAGFTGAAGTLSIVGGFARCDQEEPDVGEPTTIDGIGATPVFEIESSSQVYLGLLDITGSGTYGVRVESSATVAMELVRLRGNGGGLQAIGGATVQIAGADIYSNVTPMGGSGGGIHCHGSSLELLEVSIFNNSATDGGGLWLGAGCQVASAGTVTIAGNVASDDGGGIYLDGGSFGSLTSRGVAPSAIATIVRDNIAVDRGGGVYSTDFAFYDADNTRISGNSARQGAGAFLTGGSILRLSRNANSCRAAKCVEISSNRLGTNTLGSAAYVEAGSELYLFRGYVEENSSTAVGSAPHPLYVDSAFALLEGVQLWGNEAPALVFATNGATAQLAFVSAARNFDSAGANSRIGFAWAGATLELYSSIFQDVDGVSLAGGILPAADCLISNSFAGITAPSHSLTTDPHYRDPLNGDLSLSIGSPAVDYCDDLRYSPVERDIDGEPRGYDHPANPNASPGVVPSALGTYDLGFDEVWFFFADGFESGDLSAWSAATP